MKIEASELLPPPAWHQRSDLPGLLNDLGLLGNFCETGVQRGVFAEIVRSRWNGQRYFGVDPWRPYDGTTDTAAMHEQYRCDAIGYMESTGKPFEFLRMTSLEAAKVFADAGITFDCVFLDGDHDYEPFKAEVEAYWPLLNPGGILSGHDWIVDGIHRNEMPFEAFVTYEEAGIHQHCGPFFVRKVVAEIFPAETVSVTSPDMDRGWQSWLVRKH